MKKVKTISEMFIDDLTKIGKKYSEISRKPSKNPSIEYKDSVYHSFNDIQNDYGGGAISQATFKRLANELEKAEEVESDYKDKAKDCALFIGEMKEYYLKYSRNEKNKTKKLSCRKS